MKKILLFLFFLINLLIPQNVYALENTSFEAEVINIETDSQSFQILRVKDKSDNFFTVQNGTQELEVNNKFLIGDKIIVSKIEGVDSKDIYIASDYSRTGGLYFLFIFFAILVIFVAGLRGLTSVIGMFISFLIIFKIILPLIFSGVDAVLTAILGSILIIPVTFTLSHGLNKKTFIAGLSTVITLIITGILSVIFVKVTYLTGFAEEESSFLLNIAGNSLNFKGILLAGIIISTLGILDDITISQASIVEEIKTANEKLKQSELFVRAMNVGRDHIASLVNTLVLVYTGASMPLLLLFTNSNLSFTQAINYEMIAEEIVRTMVGSIGLVIAVPISTAIAVYFSNRKLIFKKFW